MFIDGDIGDEQGCVAGKKDEVEAIGRNAINKYLNKIQHLLFLSDHTSGKVLDFFLDETTFQLTAFAKSHENQCSSSFFSQMCSSIYLNLWSERIR